jgi:hypothetical protein
MTPARPLSPLCSTLFTSLCATALALLPAPPAQAQFAGLPLAQGIPECLTGGLSAGKCLDEIEAKALRQSAGKVTRKEGQLRLQIKPKPLLLTNDDTEGQKFINYTYLGLDPLLKQHMLYIGFYEGDQYWAIHPGTGQISKMNGYPLLNPDGLHFATMSVDMLAGFNPNLVVIWQIDSGQFKKLAEIKGDKWGPDGIKWLAANQLEVKKVCASSDPAHSEQFAPCGALMIGSGKAGWGVLP